MSTPATTLSPAPRRPLETEDEYGDPLADIDATVYLVLLDGPEPLVHWLSWYDLRATLEQPSISPPERVRVWQSMPRPSNYVHRVKDRWYGARLDPLTRLYNTVVVTGSVATRIGSHAGASHLAGALETVYDVRPFHRTHVEEYLAGHCDGAALRAAVQRVTNQSYFHPAPADMVRPGCFITADQVAVVCEVDGAPTGYGWDWQRDAEQIGRHYTGALTDDLPDPSATTTESPGDSEDDEGSVYNSDSEDDSDDRSGDGPGGDSEDGEYYEAAPEDSDVEPSTPDPPIASYRYVAGSYTLQLGADGRLLRLEMDGHRLPHVPPPYLAYRHPSGWRYLAEEGAEHHLDVHCSDGRPRVFGGPTLQCRYALAEFLAQQLPPVVSTAIRTPLFTMGPDTFYWRAAVERGVTAWAESGVVVMDSRRRQTLPPAHFQPDVTITLEGRPTTCRLLFCRGRMSTFTYDAGEETCTPLVLPWSSRLYIDLALRTVYHRQLTLLMRLGERAYVVVRGPYDNVRCYCLTTGYESHPFAALTERDWARVRIDYDGQTYRYCAATYAVCTKEGVSVPDGHWLQRTVDELLALHIGTPMFSVTYDGVAPSATLHAIDGGRDQILYYAQGDRVRRGPLLLLDRLHVTTAGEHHVIELPPNLTSLDHTGLTALGQLLPDGFGRMFFLAEIEGAVTSLQRTDAGAWRDTRYRWGDRRFQIAGTRVRCRTAGHAITPFPNLGALTYELLDDDEAVVVVRNGRTAGRRCVGAASLSAVDTGGAERAFWDFLRRSYNRLHGVEGSV